LHHHPGKRRASFTRWFRTPSGPNTDNLKASKLQTVSISMWALVFLDEGSVMTWISSLNTSLNSPFHISQED
jgi:hypothetical protein